MPKWLIPMTYTVASCILGLTLPHIEVKYLADMNSQMSVASAIALFSTISAGMLALASMVFAIAFVMVQFSAVAYSPRLVIMYANRPIMYHSLGLFFATFVYSLAMIARVDRANDGQIPLLSAWFVIGLTIGSLLAFSMLVQNLADLQIHNVLRDVGNRGRRVIRELYGAAPTNTSVVLESVDKQLIPNGPVQLVTYSGEPRTIAEIDVPALVALATEVDSVIILECAVGDTLVEDTAFMKVAPGHRLISEASLLRAVRLSTARTFEQDPKYAIRLLVDIAIRALSPAVNDPTTAVQALDQIEDLLRRLGRSDINNGRAVDSTGRLRLIFPLPTWVDYLSLSFDEIRQFGDTSVQVMRRLRSALVGLRDSVVPDHRRTEVAQYLEHLNLSVGRSRLDDQDKVSASQEDRQGLGLSRISTVPD